MIKLKWKFFSVNEKKSTLVLDRDTLNFRLNHLIISLLTAFLLVLPFLNQSFFTLFKNTEITTTKPLTKQYLDDLQHTEALLEQYQQSLLLSKPSGVIEFKVQQLQQAYIDLLWPLGSLNKDLQGADALNLASAELLLQYHYHFFLKSEIESQGKETIKTAPDVIKELSAFRNQLRVLDRKLQEINLENALKISLENQLSQSNTQISNSLSKTSTEKEIILKSMMRYIEIRKSTSPVSTEMLKRIETYSQQMEAKIF
ncbi:hypothetical protein [Arundinibacter roseus]|uniref:Uncharacterized protein n=1 Tax=Arundinibacter roseus TaxID=2070510 RepID=A0A4V2X9N7_9BACT|nr:hypothetical protein [Arundinibacter roseus]TDB64535.1 hypothetical protein EZE20_12735 [Arundinibacter roseus]